MNERIYTAMIDVPALAHSFAHSVMLVDQCLHTVRGLWIYERFIEPTEIDIATRDVLRDALLVGSRDAIERLLSDFRFGGEWMPSSILVSITQLGAARVIVNNAIAHAVYRTRFGLEVPPYDGFQFVFDNVLERERKLNIHVVCELAQHP